MEEKAHSTKAVGYQQKKSATKPIALILVLVILCGLSFYGGIAYEKNHDKTNSTAALTGSGNGGRAGFSGGSHFSGQRPIRGQVTAISATSITVQDSTSGTSTTFSITSSTTITDNSQTVTASDIQTGDTVFVVASTSSATQASRILVNPSYGGGAGQGSTTAPTATTQ